MANAVNVGLDVRIPAAAPDDGAWVAHIRAGESQAFDALVEHYGPSLAAFAYRYVRSCEAAEDLVQDLFLSLWIKRTRLTVVGSLSQYLHAGIRNRALNHLRSQRRKMSGEPLTPDVVDHQQTPDEQLSARENTMALRNAIAALPPRCREAFTLVREEQLSYADAAARMGTTVKTINAQLARAMKALRTILVS